MHRPLKHLKANGFTIVELLIVIVVIGILAAITIVTYSGVQGSARDKAVLSDTDGITGELTRYGTKNNGTYGASLAWYSPNGANSNIQFALTSGDVADVVTSTSDYCIRVFNPNSTTFKTLYTAYQKGSSDASCTSLGPSSAAIAVAGPNPNAVAWTKRASAGSYTWTGLSSSSDGNNLAAAVYSGYISTSTNGGATWTQQTSAGSKKWRRIASSSDGMKLAAVPDGDYISTSTNGGASWTQQTSAGSHEWTAVASSSDGTKLVAASADNIWSGSLAVIWTSTDSGATWTQHTIPGMTFMINAIASSSDGTKLAIGTEDNYIYTSADSGATWTQRSPSGAIGEWDVLAMSTDGTKLLTADYYGTGSGGFVYTSADSGVSWKTQTSLGTSNWAGGACSQDCSRMIVVQAFYESNYFTSTNFGSSWLIGADLPLSGFNDVASSSDGRKLIINADSGPYLYTGTY